MQRQQWNLCYVSIIHNTEKCPFIHFKNILLQGFATSWRISQKRNSILSEIIRIYLLFFALLQFRSFKKSQLRQQASFTQKDPTYSIAQIATTSNTILAAYASLQPHKSTHGIGSNSSTWPGWWWLNQTAASIPLCYAATPCRVNILASLLAFRGPKQKHLGNLTTQTTATGTEWHCF